MDILTMHLKKIRKPFNEIWRQDRINENKRIDCSLAFISKLGLSKSDACKHVYYHGVDNCCITL